MKDWRLRRRCFQATEDFAMTHHLISPRRSYPWVAMIATACAAVLVLTGCGPGSGEPSKPVVSGSATTTSPALRPAALPAPVPRADLGRVSSIETITTPGKTDGRGALIGGVVGAAVGNEVGKGDGDRRAVATGLGAVGGAVLGSEIERRNKPAVTSYRIHVRMDNGDTRSFASSNNDGLRVGDRVRVDGTLLRRA